MVRKNGNITAEKGRNLFLSLPRLTTWAGLPIVSQCCLIISQYVDCKACVNMESGLVIENGSAQ